MISLAFNKQEAQTNFESFLANATPAVQQVLTYRQEIRVLMMYWYILTKIL